ncbi:MULTISPECIES: SDR family NAD(P)-dependent oxidoreductase [unclassified Exiguobacterium]|uniref:SDR family NAD(P)-dependent oxidoreductase n=1 Tax=unclassified Exiguobacterium TaxID=2644629 RepID=UPI001BEB21FA|nr:MULTISPECIES: SDR family NAD(P)-dependent oxidoreductase [unclassified Exiguobacterium]
MNILITGATDGIGLETAKMLAEQGHTILLHGRNKKKLTAVCKTLKNSTIVPFVADLSRLIEVKRLAEQLSHEVSRIDVLINNAGVYGAPETVTAEGLDIRFAVNTIAPYMLTKALLPLMSLSSRVINVSSAAQQEVEVDALLGKKVLPNGDAYAQSKLALTMWTIEMAKQQAPAFIAINPKSLLGSKMVKSAFGIEGHDVKIGAKILVDAALSDEFKNASGKYYDNDSCQFVNPHQDASSQVKRARLVQILEKLIRSDGAPEHDEISR